MQPGNAGQVVPPNSEVPLNPEVPRIQRFPLSSGKHTRDFKDLVLKIVTYLCNDHINYILQCYLDICLCVWGGTECAPKFARTLRRDGMETSLPCH